MVMQRSTKASGDAAPGAAMPVNRDATSWIGGHPPAQPLAQSLGNGDPLGRDLRTAMEARFGRDLSHVRIHSDDRAAQVADSIGARAFTLRNHILFGKGNYSPRDSDGRRLLVHELAHVVQQQPDAYDGGLPASLANWSVSQPVDAAEREAHSAAERPGEASVIIRERTRDVLQADWTGAGIGALIGGAIGAIGGALIGGPLGALAGAGVGALAGAIIGGVAGGGGSPAAAVTFPSYSEIIADSGVQSRISAAWTSTEAAANATTRREEGFWVRKNMGTNALECTATVLGPSVGPAETGSTNFGAMPSDTNSGSATAIYIVGLFHTHTPTAFRTAGRGVGPSTADDTVHARIDRVGIIKDYVESPAGSGSIPAGHPIGSPAQLYHSGPDRRQRV